METKVPKVPTKKKNSKMHEVTGNEENWDSTSNSKETVEVAPARERPQR